MTRDPNRNPGRETLYFSVESELLANLEAASEKYALTRATLIRLGIERLLASLERGEIEMREVPLRTQLTGWASAVTALQIQEAEKGQKVSSAADARIADIQGTPLTVILPYFSELRGKRIPTASMRKQ